VDGIGKRSKLAQVDLVHKGGVLDVEVLVQAELEADVVRANVLVNTDLAFHAEYGLVVDTMIWAWCNGSRRSGENLMEFAKFGSLRSLSNDMEFDCEKHLPSSAGFSSS
jgi:hypothetical protein